MLTQTELTTLILFLYKKKGFIWLLVMWKRRTSDGPTDIHHHLTLEFIFGVFQLNVFVFYGP